MWCIYTSTHNGEYSAIKKNEILSSAITWMNLEGAVLNEMSHRERQILYAIAYMWNIKNTAY